MITEVLSRYGVSHTFVDMTNLEEIKQNIKPNTKLFYVETPSNPLLKVTDIREVSKLAKSIGALTFVDNTFLTPLFQKPLELGADIALHSITKYINGHGDVVGGVSTAKTIEDINAIKAFKRWNSTHFREQKYRLARTRNLHFAVLRNRRLLRILGGSSFSFFLELRKERQRDLERRK